MNKYELFDIEKTDKKRFFAIENSSLEAVGILEKYLDLKSLSMEELKRAVEFLKGKESCTNPNNDVKFITVRRIEAEQLLKQLKADSPG